VVEIGREEYLRRLAATRFLSEPDIFRRSSDVFDAE
jgi:hypothetical protein